MNPNVQAVINRIKPEKAYLLKEIVSDGLIPGIRTYATLYNLVTKTIDCDELIRGTKERQMGKKRVLRDDENCLKVFVDKNPWNRIGTYRAYGKDIINHLNKFFTQ